MPSNIISGVDVEPLYYGPFPAYVGPTPSAVNLFITAETVVTNSSDLISTASISYSTDNQVTWTDIYNSDTGGVGFVLAMTTFNISLSTSVDPGHVWVQIMPGAGFSDGATAIPINVHRCMFKIYEIYLQVTSS